jgi:hypothetical protein
MDKTQNEGMNQPPNEVRAAADTEEYRRAEGVKHWNQLLEKNKRIEELEAENKAVKEEWAAHIEYHKTVVAKRNELEAEVARLKGSENRYKQLVALANSEELTETEFALLAKIDYLESKVSKHEKQAVQSSVRNKVIDEALELIGCEPWINEWAGMKNADTFAKLLRSMREPAVQSSVQSPEAKSSNFPPLTKDQQYWFDLWGKGSKDIPTSWEQRPPIESPSLVNDELLQAAKEYIMNSPVPHPSSHKAPYRYALIAAIAKASKEEL